MKKNRTPLGLKPSVPDGRKRPSGIQPKAVRVDLKAIRSIDHECAGCPPSVKCCCAAYDVCVNDAEINNIIPALPEAAKFCPRLKTGGGYANVFEEAEKGLYSIDTDDNGLCVFAYAAKGLLRCSLHTVEKSLGLPPGSVKPGVCLLFPLTFSGDGGVLTLHEDALSWGCSKLRKKPSRRISPALLETIRLFGGEVPAPKG